MLQFQKIAIESLVSFLGEMEKVACIWNYFLKVVQKIYRISSLKCAYLKTHEYMVESIVDRQPLN